MDGVCPEAPVCVSVRSFLALLVPKYKYWQRDITRIYAMRRVLRQYLNVCTSKASKPRAARTCVSDPCTRFTSTQVQILTLSTYGMRGVPRAARTCVSICTFAPVKQVNWAPMECGVCREPPAPALLFWASFRLAPEAAAKVPSCDSTSGPAGKLLLKFYCQYFHFCTSKASKVST